MILSHAPVSAQNFSECFPDLGYPCTGSNWDEIYPYLADINGDPLSSCSEGQLVDAYIWLYYDNNNQKKYGTWILYEIYINDDKVDGLYYPQSSCLGTDGSIASHAIINQIISPKITITCGDTLTIKNFVISWYTSNGGRNCENSDGCENRAGGQCASEPFLEISPVPPGTIYGFKWYDKNGDGIWDMDEPPLANWNISLENNSIKRYYLTDNNGRYIFEDLSFGDYTVSEILADKPGWEQTFPVSPSYYMVTLSSTYRVAADLNFGNFFNASYTLIKIAEYDSYPNPATLGTQINYTIWINNTGKANLTEVVVNDFLDGDSYPLPDPIGDVNSDGILNVSERWIYEFNITITEQSYDVCGGWINNTVVANFSTTQDTYIEHQSWANVTIDYNSSISIAKETNVSGPVSPGDVIEYTITVCNTGNLSLKDVTVFDNRTGSYVVGDLPIEDCNTTKQIYTVTEEDLCDGSVTNYAYATALDYCDKPLVTLTNATVALDVDYNSSISIAKETNVSGPV
ncbi:MAG: hypothetical protein NUK54_09490, partial [Methanothrix sp.]|nr:hypothetical protein [Methanothrix sp.]